MPKPIVHELSQYDNKMAMYILAKIKVKNSNTDTIIAIMEKVVVAATFSKTPMR